MKSEWKKCKLGDVGKIIGGATPSTKNKENYENGKIAWITPKDLSNFRGRYISFGERNITERGLRSCSTTIMPRHSILFSSRAPIGYIAIAKNELCTNQGFKSIVPNSTTDYMFLYYLLKFNKNNIEHFGSGTTFKEVSGTTMKNIEVSLPPLPIQKKIAGILSSLDDKIELNDRINENLEAQAQAIFKAWFIDFVPFGGVMPKDWKHGTLGEICECILGGTPSRNIAEYWNGNIPWINSGQVNKFRILAPSELITKSGYEQSSTKMLPSKTTVIAITGATLGQVSLLEIDACANQSVVGIIPNDQLPYEFIYPYITANIGEIISNQTGGAQQHINKQNIKNISIFIPQIAILSDYKKIVSPIYSMIATQCFESARLSAIRDALLPRLMSGKLDVSDLDI